MTRKQFIDHMKHAGATADRAKFTRLLIEGAGKVSYATAHAAWRDGVAFARFIHERDTNKTEGK